MSKTNTVRKYERAHENNLTIDDRLAALEFVTKERLYQAVKKRSLALVPVEERCVEFDSQLLVGESSDVDRFVHLKSSLLWELLPRDFIEYELDEPHAAAHELARKHLPKHAYESTDFERNFRKCFEPLIKACPSARKLCFPICAASVLNRKFAVGTRVPDLLLLGYTYAKGGSRSQPDGIIQKPSRMTVPNAPNKHRPTIGIAYEVDGSCHEGTPAKDHAREVFFQNRGLNPLVVRNHEVGLKWGAHIQRTYIDGLIPVDQSVLLRGRRDLMLFNIATWLTLDEIDEFTGYQFRLVDRAWELMMKPARQIPRAIREALGGCDFDLIKHAAEPKIKPVVRRSEADAFKFVVRRLSYG